MNLSWHRATRYKPCAGVLLYYVLLLSIKFIHSIYLSVCEIQEKNQYFRTSNIQRQLVPK